MLELNHIYRDVIGKQAAEKNMKDSDITISSAAKLIYRKFMTIKTVSQFDISTKYPWDPVVAHKI